MHKDAFEYICQHVTYFFLVFLSLRTYQFLSGTSTQ